MAQQHLTTQLLRLSIPLIPTHGFTYTTLQLASTQLPSSTSTTTTTMTTTTTATSLKPEKPYSLSTLSALFPSPPSVQSSNPFITRTKNGEFRSKKSLSREELILEAQGKSTSVPELELLGGLGTGPLKALVKEWLIVGRERMVEKVFEFDKNRMSRNEIIKEGLRERLKWNEDVLDKNLIEALALLPSPDSTPLSSPLSTVILPFPSPLPHLEHIANIAHDLSQAIGDQSQGLEWYRTRAHLSTLYALSELHQLSKTSTNAHLSNRERTKESFDFLDRLLKEGLPGIGRSSFLGWVGRSWIGMGKSLGI